jgi:hypothetical protein
MQFLGGFEGVFQPYLRDLKNAFHIFNIALNLGCQIFRGLNSTRIQRAGKGAGQSACYPRHHMVQGGRVVGPFQLFTVFILVKIPNTAVNAEMDGLIKSL